MQSKWCLKMVLKCLEGLKMGSCGGAYVEFLYNKCSPSPGPTFGSSSKCFFSGIKLQVNAFFFFNLPFILTVYFLPHLCHYMGHAVNSRESIHMKKAEIQS